MSLKELFITHKVASIITCTVIGTAAVGGAGYGIYAVNTANNATPVAEEVVSEETTTVEDTVVTEAPVTTVEKEDKTEEVKEEKTEEVKEDTSKKEETSASKKNDSKTTTKKSENKSDTKTETKTDNKNDATKTETATSNTSNNSASGNTASSDTKKNTGTSSNSNSSTSTDTKKNTFVDDGKGSSGKWHYETIHHDAVYETQTREVHHPEQGHWEVVDDSYYVTEPVYNTETQVIDGCEYPPGTLQVGTNEVYCPHESNEWIVDEEDHWETVTEQVMVKPAWDETTIVYD